MIHQLRCSVFAALGACVFSTWAAQAQGLTQRPVNTTCVAPDRPTVNLSLTPTEAATSATASYKSGLASGVLYRGSVAPGLQGLYLYIDSARNALVARAYVSDHQFADRDVMTPNVQLLGLHEDQNGELIALTSAGPAALNREEGELPASFPLTLSASGCFDANDATQPTNGLIPYAPAATLWSDNALKRRWIAMPDWLASDTKITVLPNGDFDFPIGTVLIKEFALGTIRVETRLLVRHSDGEWAGYSYEWNDAGTDATLLAGFKIKDIAGQQWTYPARSQCIVCHSEVSNRALGPEIAQLNHDYDYGADGVANQLAVFDALGLIDGGLSAPPAQLDALPKYTDDAPVAARARGYLYANCAMCHQEGGFGVGPEDFRYTLQGTEIGALDVDPTRGDMGVAGAKLLKRGVPEESVLWLRLNATNFQRMPPLGVSIVDDAGLALIGEWIRSGSGFGFADTDGDEFSDDLDNCSSYPNPDQRDTDGDGFGNACDADLNNDGQINVVDLGLMRARFFSSDPDADIDGNGVVNIADLGRLREQFFGTPGPGAIEL
ncbi:MAG: hypothetical protein AB8G17_12765 [Gammaproteobacteria bacterium]